MATYATTTDVELELGRAASSSAESAQWAAWLERVERSIRRVFTRAGLDLMTQVAQGDPTAEDVRDVEVAAVLRKIANPTGLTSVTRSVDDASVTHRRDGSVSGDGLDLLPSEIETLLPTVSTGAFSIRPGFEPDRGGEPDWWGYEVGNRLGPWIG